MNNFAVQQALRQRSFRSVVVLFVPHGNIIVTTEQNNVIYYIFHFEYNIQWLLAPSKCVCYFPITGIYRATQSADQAVWDDKVLNTTWQSLGKG